MTTRLWIAAWAVVLVELVSPIPFVLSLGAIYVLVVRPPWFIEFVERLYGRR